ncbi:MAG: choice-of-anchor Q domain-containing protein [Myxococcota bacterium]
MLLLSIVAGLGPARTATSSDESDPSNVLRGILALEDDTFGAANTASLGVDDARAVLRGRARATEDGSGETVTLLYEARFPSFIADAKKSVAIEQATHCTVSLSTTTGYAGSINTGAKGEAGAVKSCTCAGFASAKNGKGLVEANVELDCPDALAAMQPAAPDGAETLLIRSAFLGRGDVKIKKNGSIKLSLLDECETPGPCLKAADFTVTTDADDGAGSLRQTLADAAGTPGATVAFHKSLYGGTIGLDTPLAISEDVTILGPGVGPEAVALDGQASTRVLEIDTNVVAVLEDLTITRGSEPDTGNGGCIDNDGDLTLRDVRVSSCVGRFGGAIRNDGGTADSGGLTLERVEVVDNVSVAGFGGGINNNGSTLRIRDSRIARNRADVSGGGGILNFGDGVLEIDRSTLDGNFANGPGGGIFVLGETSTTTLRDSTISGNISTGASAEGGGISVDSGDVELLNVTVVGNTDTSDGADSGGGIARSGGTLSATNSVVSGNAAGNDAQADLSTGAIDGTDLANFVGGDPNLGPLADNGGPTPTMLPIVGSPLIDAGDASVDSDRDQRSGPRVTDGDRDGTALPDIGAAERL